MADPDDKAKPQTDVPDLAGNPAPEVPVATPTTLQKMLPIAGVEFDGKTITFEGKPILQQTPEGTLAPVRTNMSDYAIFLKGHPDVRAEIESHPEQFDKLAVQTAEKQGRKEREAAVAETTERTQYQMTAKPQESVLYTYDPTRGNVQAYDRNRPVHTPSPGEVITVGGAEHFISGSDLKGHIGRNMNFALEAADLLGLPKEKAIAFVPPRTDEPEAKTQAFVDDVLLSRVSEKGTDGSLVRIDAAKAAENMRFTIMTHSFGGRFVSEAGEILSDRMKSLGYSDTEIGNITKQVLQIDYAPSLQIAIDSDAGMMRVPNQSPFNRVQLVGKNDGESRAQYTTENLADGDRPKLTGHYIFEVDTNHQTLLRNSLQNGAHDRTNYHEGLRQKPELLSTLRQAATAPVLETPIGATLSEPRLRYDVTPEPVVDYSVRVAEPIKVDPWKVPAFDVGKNPKETIFLHSEEPVDTLMENAQAAGKKKIARGDVPLKPERQLLHEVIVNVVTTVRVENDEQLHKYVNDITSSPAYRESAGNVTKENVQAVAQSLTDNYIAQNDVEKVQTYAPSERNVVFMMGGSATGKGTAKGIMTQKMRDAGVDPGISIDADAIKGVLGDRQEMGMAFADLTHQESSLIVDKIVARVDQMVGQGRAPNVIVDKTVVKPADLDKAHATGADTKIYLTVCPIEDAVPRAASRGEDSGRFVPTKMLIAIHREVTEGLPALLTYPNANITVYNTNVEKGQPAKVMASKAKGSTEITVPDPETFGKFLRHKDANAGAQSASELYDKSARAKSEAAYLSEAARETNVTFKLIDPNTKQLVAELSGNRLIIHDEVALKSLLNEDNYRAIMDEHSRQGGQHDRSEISGRDNSGRVGKGTGEHEAQGSGGSQAPETRGTADSVDDRAAYSGRHTGGEREGQAGRQTSSAEAALESAGSTPPPAPTTPVASAAESPPPPPNGESPGSRAPAQNVEAPRTSNTSEPAGNAPAAGMPREPSPSAKTAATPEAESKTARIYVQNEDAASSLAHTLFENGHSDIRFDVDDSGRHFVEVSNAQLRQDKAVRIYVQSADAATSSAHTLFENGHSDIRFNVDDSGRHFVEVSNNVSWHTPTPTTLVPGAISGKSPASRPSTVADPVPAAAGMPHDPNAPVARAPGNTAPTETGGPRGSPTGTTHTQTETPADTSRPNNGQPEQRGMKGLGAAGLANRMNAIKDGNMSSGEKVINGLAIAADGVDMASKNRLAQKFGVVGNALGVVADMTKGANEDGINGAAREGSASIINTLTSVAIFTDAGKNLLGKGPAVGGIGGFAGKAGLAAAAATTVNDTKDYLTGRKELTTDNVAGTALDTAVNFDPLKALTGLANATKLVGIDTGIQNISIATIVDKAMGGKGENISDIKNETQAIYAREQERFKAGELDPGLRGQRSADAPPSMTDYKHLGAIRHQMAKYLPEGKIDGHDVRTEFNQIDMTKPENYMRYKGAINKAMLAQEKIMEENSSWKPRWARGGESAHKYNDAESQHNLLAAAEKEFGMFENKMLQHHRERAAETQMLAKQEAEKKEFSSAIGKLDTNGDGKLSLNELDRNKDGKLDKTDLAEMEKMFGKNGKAIVDKLAANLQKNGVTFDGSEIAAVTGPTQTPTGPAPQTAAGRA